MIGSHGYLMVFSARLPSSVLLLQSPLYNIEHVHIPFQMVGFMKIAIAVPQCASQVQKMNPFRKLVKHFSQIVIGPDPQRTCTESEPIVQ
jgi:hypothetical protein